MTTPITLNDLPIGKTATVRTVGGRGALRQHFLDMGLIPNAAVTMVKRAPMGDPIEVRIKAYELTLRAAEAAEIEIEDVRDEAPERLDGRLRRAPPGLRRRREVSRQDA